MAGKKRGVKKDYSSVLIPRNLWNECNKLVENSGGRYVSISEVVREAVWNFLNKQKQ